MRHFAGMHGTDINVTGNMTSYTAQKKKIRLLVIIQSNLNPQLANEKKSIQSYL
jgi:hypothetical protein